MKIALVCGHFIPEMGYVEVYMAKELAQMGYEVKVITTHLIPKYVKKITQKEYPIGEEIHPEFNYKILRLQPLFSLGQMVRVARLKKIVDQFEPEIVIVIGVGKLFPKPLYTSLKSYKLYTLLGDSSDNQKNHTKKISVAEVRKMLKRSVYNKAIQYSDALFPYTPETIELVKQIIPKNLHFVLEKKAIPMSLGFDADTFYFDANEREAKRKQLHLDNQFVVITATRIVAYKRLEQMIDVVDVLNAQGINLHYIIVGFFDDAYSDEVKKYIQQKKYAHQFTCLPFLPNNEVRQLYAAADIAYFPTAVISIFEAMGTGLCMVLPFKNNISHILDDATNGFYVRDNVLIECIRKAIQHITQDNFSREALIYQNNKQFSWKSIVAKVILKNT